MAYVQYAADGVTITGVFANPQSFPVTQLADNDPAVVAFLAPPSAPTTLTFMAFLNLFTQSEQLAIVASTDPQVRLFTVMAAGSPNINLAYPPLVAGVNYLVTTNVVTSARAAQILSNTPHP